MRKRDCTPEEAGRQKRCGRCQKIKPLDEFGFEKKKSTYKSSCYDCRRRRPNSPRVDIKDRVEKLCPRCKKVKPIGEFRKRGAEGDRDAVVWHYCRSCNTEECRERFREKIASGEATKEYKEQYKTRRWKKLLKQYGIDQQTYETMEAAQKSLYAICDRPETKTYKGVLCRLVVDHDHVSGKVRGLLCRSCNIGLGNFYDDCERLQKAIDYLLECKERK